MLFLSLLALLHVSTGVALSSLQPFVTKLLTTGPISTSLSASLPASIFLFVSTCTVSVSAAMPTSSSTQAISSVVSSLSAYSSSVLVPDSSSSLSDLRSTSKDSFTSLEPNPTNISTDILYSNTNGVTPTNGSSNALNTSASTETSTFANSLSAKIHQATSSTSSSPSQSSIDTGAYLLAFFHSYYYYC